VRRTWRASKGLLRGEGEGEAADAAAAAAGAAAAGGGWAASRAWEGEEQEISNLQESTARIPVVISSILTLIELRG